MKKICLVWLCAGLILSSAFAQKKGNNYMEEKSEVRIQNVLAKIRRGENVNIAVLGGSITTGYSSNPIEKNSWAARVNSWFTQIAQKKDSKITFFNEGVSGTDSAFAVARVKDHIIKNNIDLVILEFSVNDLWLESQTRNKTYEGVIRQIMNGKETAVLALFINTKDSGLPSQQKDQQPIVDYYHIPFVSW